MNGQDGPEIETAPDSIFRTSHHDQLVPTGQKLLVRNHQGKFTKLFPGTEYKYSRSMKYLSLCHFCIWSDSSEADLPPDDPFHRAAHQTEVPCPPALVTPVRSRGARARERAAGMCLQSPRGSLNCALAQPVPLCPCSWARRQDHYCQNETWASVAGKCVENYFENRDLVRLSWPRGMLELYARFKAFLSHD